MMKQKREISFVLVLLGLTFIFGFVVGGYQWFPYGPIESFVGAISNFWLPTDHVGDSITLKVRAMAENREKQRLAELSQLGYLSGREPMPSEHGLLTHNPELAYGGYNFYISLDHTHAFLMDMDGKEVHTWSHPFDDDWPLYRPEEEIVPFETHTDNWRRVHLFENGDVLAIFEGMGLLKVDKDSNLLWAYRGGFHHDLEVTDDGRIFVLTRLRRRGHHAVPDRVALIEDFVTVLDADGKLIDRFSLLDAIVNSRYRDFILDRLPPEEDILHTNTLEVLRGRLESQSGAFQKGNLLVSFRNVDVIAAVDLDRHAVVWALTGMWKRQHHPMVLDNGNMLLFDNLGVAPIFSKVIEFNPFTQEIVWAYVGNQTNRFSCVFAGANQRLPNGNTLITNSMAARVFEVTPDNRIAWEWVNPRASQDDKDLVAGVYEMLRIDYDFTKSWLD